MALGIRATYCMRVNYIQIVVCGSKVCGLPLVVLLCLGFVSSVTIGGAVFRVIVTCLDLLLDVDILYKLHAVSRAMVTLCLDFPATTVGCSVLTNPVAFLRRGLELETMIAVLCPQILLQLV